MPDFSLFPNSHYREAAGLMCPREQYLPKNLNLLIPEPWQLPVNNGVLALIAPTPAALTLFGPGGHSSIFSELDAESSCVNDYRSPHTHGACSWGYGHAARCYCHQGAHTTAASGLCYTAPCSCSSSISVSCPSVPHLVLGQSGKAAPSSFCTDLTTTGTAVGTTEQCWCLLEVTAASGRDESHRAATTATEAWLELFKNPNAVTTNTIQCFNYFPLWSQLGPISNDLQLHSSKQSSDYFRLF